MDPIVVLLDLLKLCGGLGFFLYGMHVLSDGLEKLAGGKMQSVLEKITNNRTIFDKWHTSQSHGQHK